MRDHDDNARIHRATVLTKIITRAAHWYFQAAEQGHALTTILRLYAAAFVDAVLQRARVRQQHAGDPLGPQVIDDGPPVCRSLFCVRRDNDGLRCD